jgi:hypothetical protein
MILDSLQNLPQSCVASAEEVFGFIDVAVDAGQAPGGRCSQYFSNLL